MNECIVCHRIPPKEVFALVHKVLDEEYSKEDIHNISIKMCQIINAVDKENRLFFCGRRKGALLGGLLYIITMDMGIILTQSEIAKQCISSGFDVAIRTSYRRWYKNFPHLFPNASILARNRLGIPNLHGVIP